MPGSAELTAGRHCERRSAIETFKARIVRQSAVVRSPRVLQLEGLFDIPPSQRSELVWEVELPLDQRKWNIGLIVGPSGCGKTTLARELFSEFVVDGFQWPQGRSVLDAFPPSMSVKEITALLSSVGFSSPPSWLRPFAVLSNGEQFRVTLARALAESPDPVVVDEFTSVVDRTVARIGSAAVAKAVRRNNRRFVAVACHYDIIDWLGPDWVYEPATGRFSWRSVQPRPRVPLVVRRVTPDAWKLFKHHHYLDSGLNRSARCFVGQVDGQPAAFTAVLPFPHPTQPGWREHRTVCLPDFQGIGIGNGLSEFVASLFQATDKPYRSVTSSPAMIYHRARSKLWTMLRSPSRTGRQKMKGLHRTNAVNRLTASFQYVGPARPDEAAAFGILRKNRQLPPA